MGRPKMSDEKKRKARSISVRQEILTMANSTKNSSAFFEKAVDCCRALVSVANNVAEGHIESDKALEEMRRLADTWSAQFSTQKVDQASEALAS